MKIHQAVLIDPYGGKLDVGTDEVEDHGCREQSFTKFG